MSKRDKRSDDCDGPDDHLEIAIANDRILNVHECSGFLNVSPTVAQRLLRSGRIAGFKVSGQWRVRQADLINFVIESMSKHK